MEIVKMYLQAKEKVCHLSKVETRTLNEINASEKSIVRG